MEIKNLVLNKNVLRLVLNAGRVDDCIMWLGDLFQISGSNLQKNLSPQECFVLVFVISARNETFFSGHGLTLRSCWPNTYTKNVDYVLLSENKFEKIK